MKELLGPLDVGRELSCSPHIEHAAVELRITGDFNADYAALADRVATAEAVIADMPAPSERSVALHDEVRAQISAQNAARSQFLMEHRKDVYRRLTDRLQAQHRISELCSRAADNFPALVPRPDLLAAEQVLPLDQREGRESTLALLISAFLRDPQCGKHLLASMRRPNPEAWDLLREFSARGVIDLGSVTIERYGYGAVITLQNNGCLNAEDLDLLNRLELAVDVVLLSRDTRVGVIRGGVMTHRKYAGRRVFCAGINLKKLSGGQIPIVDYMISREMGLIEKFRRGLSLAEDVPDVRGRFGKPWIGAVEGFAIGGGFQMILNFDKVIASEEVYFSLPAAHEGIVPGTANFRLARHVGHKFARQMILFGEKIYAASETGKLICDDVVDADAMDGSVEAAIEQLSGAAAAANRHMLNIADEPEDELLSYLAEFCLVQAERVLSEDVIAKVKAW
ncbi:enoyl-CoA hydratase/isomerase family protein [Sphingomonas sanguinis]|uniref:enoyl-CoA hydratase/isomerase family protein n=1 Tax=Sphingomonas sanguinis TaxID=33051 RepID=UPI0009EE9973|nr:enoyl-CoA hydratase/isomerase family protein [Sphingomonas sanguinis]